MNTIADLLKSDVINARVSCGSRWLVWDSDAWCWIVYERRYGARKTRILVETRNEAEAVRVLAEDESEGRG